MPEKEKGGGEQITAVGYVGGTTLTGVIGAVSAPGLGFGSLAAAAGGLGIIAASCATGAAILLIPWAVVHAVLESWIQSSKEEERFWSAAFYRTLQIAAGIGAAVGAAILGAVVLGACANPIGASVLVGLLVTAIVAVGIITLMGMLAAPAVIKGAKLVAEENEAHFTPEQSTRREELLLGAIGLDNQFSAQAQPGSTLNQRAMQEMRKTGEENRSRGLFSGSSNNPSY